MSTRFVEDAPGAVLATAKELLAKGLVEGTAGNVSARMADGNICITPSSVDYRAMVLDDLVVIDPTGEVVSGERAASSEKALHLACYAAFEEVGSVIHSHPVHASMFAIARKPIPARSEERR
jgi:L-fuculose-phosphate aldolase